MTLPLDKNRQLVIAIAFCLAMVVLRWDWIQQQVNPELGNANVNAPAAPTADELAPDDPEAAKPSADQESSTNGAPESPAGDAAAAGGPQSERDSETSAEPNFKLTPVGDSVQESPAGLRYGPGSREGHRLKHVLLHSRDQPDRPGAHGVFDGGEDRTLRVIDEAYQIALKRGPPVNVEQQGQRTVYTVDMQRRVGYVGGQQGQRDDHPEATLVRLVLEGRNVITAFPLAR